MSYLADTKYAEERMMARALVEDGRTLKELMELAMWLRPGLARSQETEDALEAWAARADDAIRGLAEETPPRHRPRSSW